MARIKHYVKGSAKEITFSDGNSLFNISINLEDAKAQGAINKFTAKDGTVTNYLNISLAKRQEPAEWGDTHYVYYSEVVDDAKAGKSKSAKSGKPKKKLDLDDDDDGDELPF
jgi:hypothetical protein